MYLVPPQKINRNIRNSAALYACMPVLKKKIQDAGHCIPRHAIAATFGADAIELAIYLKHVRPVLVRVIDRSNKIPTQMIEALATLGWDEGKPL